MHNSSGRPPALPRPDPRCTVPPGAVARTKSPHHGVVILFAQQRPAGPYTADQVAAGRAAFQTNCASCHAENLSGAEGPELAGSNFLARWGNKTAGALINFMQSTMPPGGAALPGDTYVNIAAFILDANSARPS